MRILYISSEFPPDTGFGGIATYTKYIAQGMASLGHEVHVLCRAVNEESEKNEGNVMVHRVSCGPYPLPTGRLWYFLRRLSYKIIPQSLNRLAWAKTVYNEFSRLNRLINFNIIEYPECGAEGYYFNNRKLPLVVRLHTPWTLVRELNKMVEHPVDCYLQQYMERKSIANAKVITSPSRAMAALLNKRWRISSVTVFPNPLRSSLYFSEKLDSGWIYIGRIEYRKGVHILLSAYAEICKTHNPPKLRIVGRAFGTMHDGKEYMQYIGDLIRKNNIADRIEIIPGVNQCEVNKLLMNSSVAFFPSLWENFSYACLEAMASATVVCASDCGGFPEIIQHERNGILFNCGDSSSLIEKMVKIIDNKYNLAELANAARQSILKYIDSAEVCREAEKVYEKLSI